MMFRGCCIALAVLAGPVAAQDADAVAAMVTAIEDAGCFVDIENGDAIFEASGLSEQAAMEAVLELYKTGELALVDGQTAKLTNENCE